MTRVQAVLVLVLLVAVVYTLMYAGWRRRARRFPSAAVATTAGGDRQRCGRPRHGRGRGRGHLRHHHDRGVPARAGRGRRAGRARPRHHDGGRGRGPLGPRGRRRRPRPVRLADRSEPRAGHGRQVGRPEPPGRGDLARRRRRGVRHRLPAAPHGAGRRAGRRGRPEPPRHQPPQQPPPTAPPHPAPRTPRTETSERSDDAVGPAQPAAVVVGRPRAGRARPGGRTDLPR